MLHLEVTTPLSAQDARALKAFSDALLANATPVPAIEGKPPKAVIEEDPTPPPPPTTLAVVPPPPSGTAVSNPVPVAPVAAGLPAGVELDAEGLPWDGRIHAAVKTQTVKGVWKLKKSVDANLVNQVQAEHRQALAAVPPPPQSNPAAAFGAASAAPDDAAPSLAPATAPEDAAPPLSEFTRIMKIVGEKQAAGVLTTEMSASIAQALGLPNMMGLMLNPALIPAFEAALP